MAACRGPCGGKESSGQGFTIRSTNAIQNAPDPALVHLTPVTGRRPTPAHYSHPDPMDHSQWYACTCTCIVATLACIVPITHASPNFQKSLGQSAWPLPCRVRMESNARDSETARLRGLTSWKKLQPHFRLYCHYYRRISSALRHASTCVLPRNATQHLKWAWLVPTIPLPPDDRLIDNSILPSIRRFFFFVDRRPALLAFFFPVPGTRPSPRGTLYSLAACRCHSSVVCFSLFDYCKTVHRTSLAVHHKATYR
jgi:hypothetical protein